MQRLLEVLKRLSEALPRLSGGKLLPGNAMSDLTDPRFEPQASRFRDERVTALLLLFYRAASEGWQPPMSKQDTRESPLAQK